MASALQFISTCKVTNFSWIIGKNVSELSADGHFAPQGMLQFTLDSRHVQHHTEEVHQFGDGGFAGDVMTADDTSGCQAVSSLVDF